MIDTGNLGALSLGAQAAYREAYAICLLAQLAITAPSARRFFCSERYGGYVARGALRDALYRPSLVYAGCALWCASAICLAIDRWTLAAAIANVVLCRLLLIGPRWNSLSRGFGAVGQITAWSGVTVCLLEITRVIDHGGLLRAASVGIARVDFGLIMLVAGFYKVTAGYVRGDGFESALANPWWCFWSKYVVKLSPRHPFFAVMNHGAYLVEMAAGVLMLTPFYEYGALAIALSFAMLGISLRLTVLPWMVVSAFLLFVAPGGTVDRWLNAALPVTPAHPGEMGALWIAAFGGVCAYGVAIVGVRAGLYYNFFARKRLPETLQVAVDVLSSHLLITIWRVFTANVVNFYVEVGIRRADGAREAYERIGLRSVAQGLRYAHAGEFVALCTTFTTLKYFPDRPEIFEERLLRYARSVPAGSGELVSFTFVSITKNEHFCRTPAAEFLVDTDAAKVTERPLLAGFDVRAASPSSRVVRAAAPGTYAPARQ